MKNSNKLFQKKIIVILGPTATGKSELAIKLAKEFNGEIISADSRQVYRGMDIGAGKVAKKDREGIPHHLLDVTSPKRRFTVSQYKKLAEKAINKILEKKKTPILCGGTGFYIQALIDGITIPEVSPDWKLRKKLEQKSVEELYLTLKRLDPARARNIERKNPRRLIRAIEIVSKTKKTIPPLKKIPLPYPVLIIGMKKPKKELKKSIEARLFKRLKKGMVAEVNKLHKIGISWKRLEEFGLEYRWISRYLQKKISYKEMVKRLKKDIERFAKRQITWFKRDKRIRWVPTTSQTYKYVRKLVEDFLVKK